MSNQSHSKERRSKDWNTPMLYSYENMEPDTASGSGLSKNILLLQIYSLVDFTKVGW